MPSGNPPTYDMQIEEKIYFRERLGVKCSSTQIAYSYLEGRIAEGEVFSENGRKICFSDLLLQDEMVRGIIRASNQTELFPQQHKFDTFSERYELFRKIVIRGDDSTASFLIELDEKTELIVRLQKDLQLGRSQLSCWKKNNDDLIDACQNALLALRDFGVVIDAQKRNIAEDSDLFRRYSDILEIIKLLTNDLCARLQKNIVIATVPNLATKDSVEKAQAIDDFRVITERVLAKREADLNTLVVSTHQELDTLRAKAEKKIQDDMDAFARLMESEHQTLLADREKCEKRIDRLKRHAIEEIKAGSDNLTAQMIQAGEFDNTIRANAHQIFTSFPVSDRCHVFPNISPDLLYSSLRRKCFENVAPISVLAIFDCSFRKNGSAGVLVTSHAFYLFNDMVQRKYQLHINNKITTETKKSAWRIAWIITGIASIILAIPTSGVSLFGLISFVFAPFCSGSITIKFRDKPVITFPAWGWSASGLGLIKFCNAVNQLCNSCTLTKDQIEKIEKMSL